MVENEGNVSSEQADSQIESQTEDSGAEASQHHEAPVITEPKSLREKVEAIKAEKDKQDGADKQAAAPKAFPDGKGGTQSMPTQHQPGTAQPSVPGTPPSAADGTPPAVFTPNLKYKYRGEEKDIPAPLHSAIKDADSEKLVRELVEKSAWMDESRPTLQKKAEEFEVMNRGLANLDRFLERDPSTKKVKDFGRFTQAFGLTEDDVLHHAQDIIQYRTAEPDQQKQMDYDRQRSQQLEQLREENERLQQTNLNFESQTKESQLTQLAAHPMVSPVVEKYLGGAQAFNRDVATYAYLVEVQSQGKILLSPEQAVAGFMQSRGLNNNVGQAASQSAAAVVPGSAPQVPPPVSPQAPTLPKVTSQNTSPAKKVVSSLKDIRKARDAALAAQG